MYNNVIKYLSTMCLQNCVLSTNANVTGHDLHVWGHWTGVYTSEINFSHYEMLRMFVLLVHVHVANLFVPKYWIILLP